MYMYMYVTEKLIVISSLPGLYFVHKVCKAALFLPDQHMCNISPVSISAQNSLMSCGYPLPSLNMAGAACQVRNRKPLSHSANPQSLPTGLRAFFLGFLRPEKG